MLGGRFSQALRMGLSPKQAEDAARLWKKSSAAPDYTPMLEATEYAVDTYERVADRQLAETRRQYDELAPITRRISDAQLGIMDQQKRQGDDYYNYMKKTFRPVEKGLADEIARYNTDAERERMAGQAAADVSGAVANEREVTARHMARMGINPNSGKALATMGSQGLRAAGMKAGAMTGARQRAKELGYAKRLDAAGLGRGLVGASQGAYGGAVGAGSAGANTNMSSRQFLLGNMATAGNFAGQGAMAGLQGQGNILNSQTSIANTKMQGQSEMLGAAVGAGAMMM